MKNPITKTMAAAAGLAAALTLTACGGSGAGDTGTTDTGTNADASSPAAAASDSAACRVIGNDDFTKAEWTGTKAPTTAILIDQAYPLPESMSAYLTDDPESFRQAPLVPLPGNRVAVNLPYEGTEHFDELAGPDTFVGREAPGPQVAIYDASGEQISFEIHPWNEPDPLSEIHGQVYGSDKDLTEQEKGFLEYQGVEIGKPMPTTHLPKREGFFRTITDDVDVPGEATEGLSPGRSEFLAITPDTNDDDTVWVLMAGGTDLYKGTVVQADEDARPADCA